MEQSAPEEKLLRQALSEIIQGFSTFEYKDATVYIKHFNQEDQALLENQYQEVFEKAKKQGLPTEEETLQMLKDEDLWTEEEENQLISQKKYIDNLHDTKTSLIIPSQVENIRKDIEEAEKEYNELSNKKQSLLHETCEGYAKKKNNDYSLYLSFYKSSKCIDKFFSKEEFYSLPKQELQSFFQ